MEEIFEIIKNCLKDILPDYLKEKETEECKLPLLTEKNIVFGPVDVSRYELPVVCAVLPGDQTSEDVSISEWDDNTDFTVAFVCQKADSQTLTKRMCRYASAFKELIKKNPTFSDAVENVEFRKASFFYDAGAVEDQVMVAEIEMTIITANEF